MVTVRALPNAELNCRRSAVQPSREPFVEFTPEALNRNAWRAGLLQRFVMWAMGLARTDNPRPRTAMDVERSRAWPGARRWRNTEQLGRDLDRPAREPAARDLAKARVQARVQRNPSHRDGPMRFNAIAARSRHLWFGFARITLIR